MQLIIEQNYKENWRKHKNAYCEYIEEHLAGEHDEKLKNFYDWLETLCEDDVIWDNFYIRSNHGLCRN